MKKAILFTAAVFFIATAHSFAQTEESRYINGAGNLVILWSDGTRSTYGKDPTGKQDLAPDPKVAERMYDAAGNRREIDRDGRTRVIEAGDESVRADRMNDRVGIPPRQPAEQPKPQTPK
jgi:hypothetical protein